ncbi:MAG TPA: lysophospholipid acyltransferase family protein [Chromobacteriaceae bacterium]|nr:lysophospholipid acyltransferase family protein [Chromobacteriaceae bacterium]
MPRTLTSTTTPYLVRLTRLCRLGLHLTRGILIVATRYKRLAQPERAVVTRRWSAQLLKILGISLKVNGLNPGFYPPNTLLVANHVSWLDIFVLNSVTVSRFVAKREIRDWPVIGWLVQVGGTLFIDRSNRRDACRVNQQLAEALAKGGCMAVFPEATTSDGRGLLPFKSSLFEAALLAKGTVQPVALRYQLPDGELTTAAAYAGDTTFWQSLSQMLAVPAMEVELTYGQPLKAGINGLDNRFQLSELARLEISKSLRLPLPDTPDTVAKTAADPQAVAP